MPYLPGKNLLNEIRRGNIATVSRSDIYLWTLPPWVIAPFSPSEEGTSAPEVVAIVREIITFTLMNLFFIINYFILA